MTPEEKYLRDPHYHKLVDMLFSFIHKYEFTPTELREAVIFACTKFEMSRTVPIINVPKSSRPPTCSWCGYPTDRV
jgi:hypothetical protein